MRGFDAADLMQGYLPLSGGTITGEVFAKQGNYNPTLAFRGNSDQEGITYGALDAINVIRGRAVVFQNTLGNWGAQYRDGNLIIGGGNALLDAKGRLHIIGNIYCTGKVITDGGVQDNSQKSVSQQIGGGYFGILILLFALLSQEKGGQQHERDGYKRSEPSVYAGDNRAGKCRRDKRDWHIYKPHKHSHRFPPIEPGWFRGTAKDECFNSKSTLWATESSNARMEGNKFNVLSNPYDNNFMASLGVGGNERNITHTRKGAVAA